VTDSTKENTNNTSSIDGNLSNSSASVFNKESSPSTINPVPTQASTDLPQPNDPNRAYVDDLYNKKILPEINNLKIETTKDIENFKKYLMDQFTNLLKKETDVFISSSKKIDKVKDQTEKIKSKIIETLGIYVALFTFVSVNFQILKDNKEPLMALLLIFILLGGLIFFILVLDLTMNDKTVSLNPFKGKFILLKGLFFTSLFLLFTSILGTLGLLIGNYSTGINALRLSTQQNKITDTINSNEATISATPQISNLKQKTQK
jgi:hypothetical protein